MTTFFCLLSILFAFTSASHIRGKDRRSLDLPVDINVDGIHDTEWDLMSRKLRAARCPYDGGTVTFSVETRVDLDPTLEYPTCSDETLVSIGVMINSALLNAGITTYDQSVFLAGVCNTPVVANGGKNGAKGITVSAGHVTGGGTGFIWTGGGGCRNCNRDNRDGRLLSSSALSSTSNQALVEKKFLKNVKVMESKITAAVTKGLKVYRCLGTNPKVSVTVQVVKLWELQVKCAGEVITSGLEPLPLPFFQGN